MWAVLAQIHHLGGDAIDGEFRRAFPPYWNQWAHIMPSIIMVFFIAVSPFFFRCFYYGVGFHHSPQLPSAGWFLWNLGLKSFEPQGVGNHADRTHAHGGGAKHGVQLPTRRS